MRGASERCLVVVDGPPGLGKTTILSRRPAENACVITGSGAESTLYLACRDHETAVHDG